MSKYYEKPLYYKSFSIPAAIRPDVVEVVQRNQYGPILNHEDLHYLFEVYNRYIAPADEPEDAECAGCRTKVIGRLRQMTLLWNQNGIHDPE